jgi:prevent-host-death family protein
MWTISNAKAQLSEVLRRARDGEPQVIGTNHPCVIIAKSAFDAMTGNNNSKNQWLTDIAALGGFKLPLPSRKGSRKIPALGD